MQPACIEHGLDDGVDYGLDRLTYCWLSSPAHFGVEFSDVFLAILSILSGHLRPLSSRLASLKSETVWRGTVRLFLALFVGLRQKPESGWWWVGGGSVVGRWLGYTSTVLGCGSCCESGWRRTRNEGDRGTNKGESICETVIIFLPGQVIFIVIITTNGYLIQQYFISLVTHSFVT